MEKQVSTALKTGPRSNKELRSSFGMDLKNYNPKLDRALQKMRKDGKIQLVAGRWALSSFKLCPTCEGKGWTPSRRN